MSQTSWCVIGTARRGLGRGEAADQDRVSQRPQGRERWNGASPQSARAAARLKARVAFDPETFLLACATRPARIRSCVDRRPSPIVTSSRPDRGTAATRVPGLRLAACRAERKQHIKRLRTVGKVRKLQDALDADRPRAALASPTLAGPRTACRASVTRIRTSRRTASRSSTTASSRTTMRLRDEAKREATSYLGDRHRGHCPPHPPSHEVTATCSSGARHGRRTRGCLCARGHLPGRAGSHPDCPPGCPVVIVIASTRTSSPRHRGAAARDAPL